jgi:hypothetical protein
MSGAAFTRQATLAVAFRFDDPCEVAAYVGSDQTSVDRFSSLFRAPLQN